MKRDRYRNEEQALRALLREQRNSAGLRQADLAGRLGVPQSFVSKYESGERLLTFLEALTIFRELGIGVEEVIARLPEQSHETKP